MERQGPPIHKHPVQILTPDFQFTGDLEVVGDLMIFVNDVQRETITLSQVTITPLSGGPLRPMTRPEVCIPKNELVCIFPIEPASVAEIRLLQREEPIVVYTPPALIQGNFRLPTETKLGDILTALPGIFLTATDAKIFALTQLSTPFPETCHFLLIGKAFVRFYHSTPGAG